ncbi:MAG: 2-oxoacid:ferredoxin oxidoreductase subunit beta, partial [Bacteroidales bacterium]|nr:2-oxoacid:ferredoxin oxidoreductase subunit beta [Bacteroidales bacterium]
DILTHDARNADNLGIHTMLAEMKLPDYPVALGVIRNVEASTFETALRDQGEMVTEKSNIRCVDDLLRSGSTWEVK